ncbi:MAG: polyhydroxyalkanoate synthesis repressor PhaR [Alphaproteobacteria bacterium]|nr:polyhydroxyalkanoate synthesis repressor PhaR [Alphaproteobacteria bacterium]
MAATKEGAPIRIRKYANRRLYNTATSSYVTLADLARLVRDDIEFSVEDAKSGEDLTRATLTQIIVDEEQNGANLLPVSLLRRIISMYRDNAGWMLPGYLEQSMQWFVANQDAMRREFERAYGPSLPFGPLDDLGKRNLALFEQAMRFWSPFETATPEPEVSTSDAGSELQVMRREITRMQERLDALAGKGED